MKAFVKLMPMMALLVLASCNNVLYEEEESAENTSLDTKNHKKFTFTCKGDFSAVSESSSGGPKKASAKKSPTYLSENEQNLTDLWVLDYADGVLIQQLHQSPSDEGWGAPVMQLAYGTHHIYFVASRGTEPSLSTETGTISWTKTSDTYWTDYEVTVQKTSNGNRAVTLERVATMFSITITDVLPEGLATVGIKPEHWYYGLNYMTGDAVSDLNQERVVNIPSSKIGTSDVQLNIYGISPASEWTTDVTVNAASSDGSSLGTASILNAPFVRNRVTHYTGSIFSETTPMSISVESEWLTPYEGTW